MKVIKITSGKYRGRVLATPGGKTHPMGERERLALFNMISSYIPGAMVLDAYAGSGALGFEALSRGAKKVTFIDKANSAIHTIKKNLDTLDIEANNDVIKTTVSEMVAAPESFNIILADPPYDNFRLTEIEYLAKYLKRGGILVLSHPGDAPSLPEILLDKSRKYAGATISIYLKK